MVERAVSAVNALESLDRCANVPLLRAVMPPPADADTRRKVDELRNRLSDVKARFDAGKWREEVQTFLNNNIK